MQRDRTEPSTSRAVSPNVGYILILGFILFTAVSTALLAQGYLSGTDNPRIEANFELEFNDSINSPNIIYDTGDGFDTSNTEELFVRADVEQSGNNITIEKTLFNESGVQYGPPGETNTQIAEGQTVMTAKKANQFNITSGTPIEIVWKPANEDEALELIVDEFIGASVIPIDTTVGTVSGNITGGGGVIDYD